MTIKNLLLSICLAFVLFLSQVAHSKIILVTGQTHKIPLALQSDVHVSNGQVIQVNDTGKELIVVALKPGHSAISSGAHKWLIQVISRQKFQQRQIIQKTLQKLMGLQADWSLETPRIKGVLHRSSDLPFLFRQLQPIPHQLHIQVSPDIRHPVEDYLKTTAQRQSFPPPQVQWTPHLALKFSHINPAQQEEVQTYYKSHGIPIHFSKQGLKIEPLIEVKILIAEVHRSLQRHLGIHWESNYTAQLLPLSTSTSNLALTLQALESKGRGQVLASPRLLCRSGSKAEFLAGGEFPIKVINFRKKDVLWKRHGVHLSVLPTADTQKRLSIQLSTEISMIDPSQSVDNLPGLKTNRLQTHFDLKQPRTIALSGLLRHDFGISSQGLPALHTIPVIGKLFGSEDYKKKLTELVIFVTPRIIEDSEP